MKVLLFLLFVVITGTASAQFFSAVPKPKAKLRVPASMLAMNSKAQAQADEASATEKNEFRPVTNLASYIIGKDVKESSIITGAGVGYQHLKYNAVTEKWNIVWSINALAYGRIALGNESNGKKILSGISIGAFDNLLMVGYATDFKTSYGTIGVGIPLNNL